MASSENDCVMRSYLLDEAARLASSYSRLAVPIGRIAFDHGIHIERCDSVKKFKAHMSLPRTSDDWVRVFLPPVDGRHRPQGPSAYERFCVAHELAHLLILRKFQRIPSDQTMYWHHEALCDEFARALLIPQSAIEDIDHASDRIASVQGLVPVCKVPFMHIARRVTDLKSSVFYIRLELNSSKKWRAAATSFQNGKETGKIFSGLLDIRISKFVSSGASSQRWSFSGRSLIESSLASVRDSDEFVVSALKDVTKDNSVMVCLESVGESVAAHA